jgi:hypothetical protein
VGVTAGPSSSLRSAPITHILAKLGLRDVQAVVLAHETGLLDTDAGRGEP